jgi:hypothetical protein
MRTAFGILLAIVIGGSIVIDRLESMLEINHVVDTIIVPQGDAMLMPYNSPAINSPAIAAAMIEVA